MAEDSSGSQELGSVSDRLKKFIRIDVSLHLNAARRWPGS